MDWTLTDNEDPEEDGTYAVIYRCGPYVSKFTCDFSVQDGWLTGMMPETVQILAWMELPQIPREILIDVGAIMP